MTLQYSDIDDAVLLTQEIFINKGSFLDLQTDLQDHVAVRELWKGKKKVFEGGNDWVWHAQIDHNHSYKAVGMYETDTSSMVDTMIEGKVSPRHVNAHYIYDLKHPDFQRGATKIVDFVQTKYNEMMVSFYEGLETDLWTCPSSTDAKALHGLPYWITKGTAGQEGWYGVDPSGYSAGRGNILTASYDRWSNYFADYTAIADEDLVRKLRVAAYKTQFRSPLSHAQPDLGAMSNGIYCNCNTITLLEEALTKNNMNLGTDLAFGAGRATFKGTPLTYVPKLDADTQDPLYFIDWKWLVLGVLAGWENQLSAPYMVPGKHLVRRVDLDATMELVCTNLRRQAVFAKV